MFNDFIHRCILCALFIWRFAMHMYLSVLSRGMWYAFKATRTNLVLDPAPSKLWAEFGMLENSCTQTNSHVDIVHWRSLKVSMRYIPKSFDDNGQEMTFLSLGNWINDEILPRGFALKIVSYHSSSPELDSYDDLKTLRSPWDYGFNRLNLVISSHLSSTKTMVSRTHHKT